MILADTSVWIDHLRRGDAALSARLMAGDILGHPLVAAEIALGSLSARGEVLALLDGLPAAPVATMREVRHAIEMRGLSSRGIGFVDAALIAAVLLAPGARLWSRDRRLDAVARDLGIAAGGA